MPRTAPASWGGVAADGGCTSTSTSGSPAELVARLRSEGLLRSDLALNVNQPFVDAGESAGPPVMTVIGESNDIPMLLDGRGRHRRHALHGVG